MPTYEYRCPQGHEFEEFQRMSDPPVATCPVCGTELDVGWRFCITCGRESTGLG